MTVGRGRAMLSVAAAVCLIAGCAGVTGEDKAGAGPPTVQLVLANNDGNLIGVPALRRFLERVDQLSAGRVTITVESRWRGGDDEPRVVRDVAAGTADLGWVGTRALDRVGVDAFRPLHAPLLIDSYAAESAVVGDDSLTKQLVASLSTAGVTGLALMADELRHPAGVTGPLVTPAAFAGITFATVDSGAQSEGIAALGAQPTTGQIRAAANDGGLGGLETMWWSYAELGYGALAPYLAANVTLWPRTWVLFANPESLTRIGAEAQGWVTRAAADAAAWSVAHPADHEPTEVGEACAGGARVATATDAQLAALRRAAEPAYTRLRSDPGLHTTMERIEQDVAHTQADQPLAVPDSCRFRPGEEKQRSQPPLLTSPGDPGRLQPGTYRYRLTTAEIEQSGVNAHDAQMNAGVWTWTLGDGRWSYVQDPATSEETLTSCAGFYDVRGDSAAFTTTTLFDTGDCAPRTWTARWTTTGDWLIWSGPPGDFAPIFSAQHWRRIG